MLKTLAAASVMLPLALSPGLAKPAPSVVYAKERVPDGHPFLIQTGSDVTIYPVPPRPLQYALIDGRRALVDPDTLAVIYWLRP